jgi:hypothetical protein
MQNNVSLGGKNADQPKSQNNAANDHNTWNSGFACSVSDFQSLDTTQVLIYRRSDGSLSETPLLRPAAQSALIDAGIDVNLGYNGAAPDLGCFEAPGERHDPLPDDTIPEVQPEGTHAIAFVTLPGAAEDKALLHYLRQNDSLWVVETDATNAEVDYSTYEVIVLGSKPNSGAAGFRVLKGYDKPMVLLKPFLLKSGVWDWGTAANTQDLGISVSNPEHALFSGLTITDGILPLFSACNTNAVTAISAWNNTTGYELLGAPLSQSGYTTVADFPAGTNCNGTILPQRLIMIGVSEYSTANLTAEGKKLIENAICLLLGIPNKHPQGIENQPSAIINKKFIHNGQLFIQTGDAVYSIDGRRVIR